MDDDNQMDQQQNVQVYDLDEDINVGNIENGNIIDDQQIPDQQIQQSDLNNLQPQQQQQQQQPSEQQQQQAPQRSELLNYMEIENNQLEEINQINPDLSPKREEQQPQPNPIILPNNNELFQHDINMEDANLQSRVFCQNNHQNQMNIEESKHHNFMPYGYGNDNVLHMNAQEPEQPYRSPLPPSLNEIYYKVVDKSNNQKQINFKAEESKEPYMKISVMKTNMELGNQQVYYVTAHGLVDTQKNTSTEDIIIGRQQSTTVTENKVEIHPNDIILPASDRAISRIHCKIIYKEGFFDRRQIPNNFLQFLMITHKRSGSGWQCIPPHILRWIWYFVQNERKFYLVDIGSVYGTYIRVRPQKPQIVEKGQVYLIGADTVFNIQEVNVGCPIKNQQLPKSNSMFNIENQVGNFALEQQQATSLQTYITNIPLQQQQQLQQMPIEQVPQFQQQAIQQQQNYQQQENQDIFSKLASEKQQGAKIYGLTEAENQMVESYQNRSKMDNVVNETQLIEPISNRPYLKLEIQNSNQQNSQHIFVENPCSSSEQQHKEFKIGRSQECDIVINQNTISRKQSRIFFQNGNWYLMDGDRQRESANGTWISLTDYREKKSPQGGRQESEPKEIEHQTEIKISDSILKIEIFNNSPSKKRGPYQQQL